MKLKIEEITRETSDSVSLYFKNPAFFNSVKYKSGQFMTLGFQIENHFEKRAYSFSSSPYIDKYLRVTVKKVEGGLVSNYIYNELKTGQKIQIEKPSGNFYIEPESSVSRKIILFGAGSGITPLMSMSKTILHKEPNSEILLFYANNNSSSIIFKDELEDLKLKNNGRFQIVHILKETDLPAKNIYQGYLRKEIVEQVFAENKWTAADNNYFMCGPAGYMDKAKEILAELGVEKSKIKTEAFVASKIIAPGNLIVDSEISFINKGVKMQFPVTDKKTILQGALTANLEFPYSCRSGMCSTCKAKCLEGKVKMTDGHFLSDKEVNDGYILSCISYPLTDKVLIELP